MIVDVILGDADRAGLNSRMLVPISGFIQSVAYRWVTDQPPLFSEGQWLRVHPRVILDSLIWSIWAFAIIAGYQRLKAQPWNLLGLVAFSWISFEAIRSEATQTAAWGALLATLTYWRINEGGI
jgi:hypothetical protein